MNKNKYDFFVDKTKYNNEFQILTGAQIRRVANVGDGMDLYLKIPGHNDELIDDDKSVNLARPGVEHFYTRPRSEKQIIVVNTVDKPYEGAVITYEQVVELAGFDITAPDRLYTVTYLNGPVENESGQLFSGESVFVKHKMIFNVDPTIRS